MSENLSKSFVRVKGEFILPLSSGIRKPFSSGAEDRGFRAVIEEPTADETRRVDLGLDQNGKKIACEVFITDEGD